MRLIYTVGLTTQIIKLQSLVSKCHRLRRPQPCVFFKFLYIPIRHGEAYRYHIRKGYIYFPVFYNILPSDFANFENKQNLYTFSLSLEIVH